MAQIIWDILCAVASVWIFLVFMTLLAITITDASAIIMTRISPALARLNDSISRFIG